MDEILKKSLQKYRDKRGMGNITFQEESELVAGYSAGFKDGVKAIQTTGKLGQKLMIKDKIFYIGDVVKLIDKKKNISAYYQIMWCGHNFQIFLENEDNKLSIHPHNTFWYTGAFIPLYKIIEGHVTIERIGCSKKDLKLIQRTKNRAGLKPTK